jgi:hypothetical protein
MRRTLPQVIDFPMSDVSRRSYSKCLIFHGSAARRSSPYYYVIEAAPRRLGSGAQP